MAGGGRVDRLVCFPLPDGLRYMAGGNPDRGHIGRASRETRQNSSCYPRTTARDPEEEKSIAGRRSGNQDRATQIEVAISNQVLREREINDRARISLNVGQKPRPRSIPFSVARYLDWCRIAEHRGRVLLP